MNASPDLADAPRLAVVGAGPAGLFAADAILKKHPTALVDLIDQLPTPFGLARYGVAPDNLKMKSVLTTLTKILGRERLRFLGNVRYGSDVTWADLDRHYAGVIFATGAPATRSLGIPGEDLPGSEPAATLVSWYNGYPGHRHELPLGSVQEVAVIGAGNVALDVARLLVHDPDGLVHTDIPGDALELLSASEITDVHIIARRSPAFAKFSTAELREFDHIPNLDIRVRPEDFDFDSDAAEHLEANRNARLMVNLLKGWADAPPKETGRRVHFRFAERPTEIVGDERVAGIRLERRSGARSGETVLPVQMVLRSVGYRCVPLSELPFSAADGTVPHCAGRVTGFDGAAFVAGWAKRGPSGVIGTNKADAGETVDTLLKHLESRDVPHVGEDLLQVLRSRGCHVVSREDWTRIEALEMEVGAELGRDRVKVTELATLLAARHQPA